jgi:hypothetical protein
MIKKEPKEVTNLRRREKELQEQIASAQRRNATEEVKALKGELAHISRSVKDYAERERQATSGSK